MESPNYGGGAGRVDTSAYDASNYRGRRSSNGSSRGSLPKDKKIIIGVVVGIVAILLMCGVAFALCANAAKNDAKELVSQGKVLVKQFKDDDRAKTQEAALKFASIAKNLDGNVSNPLWTVASVMPVFGSDISQVRTLAKAINTLSNDVLLPMVDGAPEGGFGQIVHKGGFDVQAISAILGPLGNASDEISKYADEMNNAGEVHIEQLKEPLETAKSAMNLLNMVAAEAPALSQSLPDMLGANGKRYYLILACTNSELRPTGGMPGQFGIMSFENGKMKMSPFRGCEAAPTLPEGSKLPIPEEEERLFGTRVACEVRDANFIPDFPRVAELEKQLWERYNAPIQGIVAIDPIFLQRILKVTGPVDVFEGIVCDGDNAAEVLMNTVYLKYGDNSDAHGNVFRIVANSTLDKLFNQLDKLDLIKLAQIFMDSFQDRHFYAWMENPNEEALLERIGCSGKLSDDPVSPSTGVFLGSAMGCKIFWYMDVDTTVGPGRKNADGSTSYEVNVVIKNLLSEEEAQRMPYYIRGEDEAQRGRSDMPIDIYLFAPAGGRITDVKTTGFFQGPDYYHSGWNTRPGVDPMTSAEYRGFNVWYGMTQVMGNETTTLTYTVTTSDKAVDPLVIDMTPLPNEKLQ